jgi:WD40 repeat protein
MRILILVLMAMTVSAQPAGKMLEAARHKEVMAGDLKGAIAEYRKIAARFGKDAEVAAEALWRMGQCQEKLGEAEARRSYERVVKEYGGAARYAAQARARLAAMGGGGGGLRARLLWDEATDLSGRVSADGRYLSFVDWKGCDLGLRDLVTGESKELTNRNECKVGSSAVSPEGKRVAYMFGRVELRVVGTDGTGDRLLTKLTNGPESYIDPQAWSPDGKWIAAPVVYRDDMSEEDALVLVSAETGQVRRFALDGKVAARDVAFSPDGQWLAYSTGGAMGVPAKLRVRSAVGENTPEKVIAENALILGWARDGRIVFVRELGGKRQLFVLPMSGGEPAGAPFQLYAAADLDGALPAGLTTQGNLLYKATNMRAEARVLPVDGGEPLVSVPTSPSMGWMSLSGGTHFSHDGTRLLTVTPDNALSIRDLSSGAERIVVPRVKTFKAMRWAHDDRSVLVMGESREGKTGVMRVHDVTGAADMLLELPAETWGFTISRDGKTIFFGTPKKTEARNIATGESRVVWESALVGNYDLRVSRDGKRLAIRGGQYLTVVNMATWQAKEIWRSPENSAQLMWALDWTSDDARLVTTVRAGGAGPQQTWVFSPEGGAPEKKDWLENRTSVSISPDGKWVAQTRRKGRAQVWVLENFLPAK